MTQPSDEVEFPAMEAGIDTTTGEAVLVPKGTLVDMSDETEGETEEAGTISIDVGEPEIVDETAVEEEVGDDAVAGT